MNTGSGKTIVGLIILLSLQREKRGSAAFFVPNRQLQEQTIEAAKLIGINVTDDPKSSEFQSGQGILVTTIQKLFNAKSVFGVDGNNVLNIEIDYLIIDDAHACIPIIESQYTFRIDKNHASYAKMLRLFSGSLSRQSANNYKELEDPTGVSVVVPIEYSEWSAKYEEALTIIRETSDTDEYKYKWDLISEQAHLANVIFTEKSIDIKLPFPNINSLPSFADAQRKIYMTATLANDSSLVSLGADEKCVLNPIVPSTAGDIGDRIIFSPIQDGNGISKKDIMEQAAAWGEYLNVVVIVPSKYQAKEWEDYTDEIHDKNSILDVIERLKSDNNVGLVVLIARYDGVDLPNNACRILILDGLPKDYSAHALYESNILKKSEKSIINQIQRVEQGMGRGVRHPDDYCAVMLLDPHLASYLHNSRNLNRFSPGTQKQYEFSNSFFHDDSDREERNIEFYKEVVEAFLSRDDEWVTKSKESLGGIQYKVNAEYLDLAIAEHRAFQEALIGDFSKAGEILLNFADKNNITNREKGFLYQKAAGYINNVEPTRAQALQRSAKKMNPSLLKIEFNDFQFEKEKKNNQALNIQNFIEDLIKNEDSVSLWAKSIMHDLTPSSESGTYQDFESAMETVGKALGFYSTRPDQVSGLGPDNLWGLGDGEYMIIECKSEATTSSVSRHYFGQLSQSVEWFKSKFGDSETKIAPVIIFPTRKYAKGATPPENSCVIDFSKLEEFRSVFYSYIIEVCKDKQYQNIDFIKRSLQTHNLNSKKFVQFWTKDFIQE